MRRLASALLLGALGVGIVGCGGSSSGAGQATTRAAPDPADAMRALIATDPRLAGTVRTLFQGSSWALVQSTTRRRANAVAFSLTGGAWHADRSGRVKIEILGPQPGAHAPLLPQVAVEIRSPAPFVESGLWLDGVELFEKGGGSPTRGTIYGAPAKEIAAGPHVAVGFARTGSTASAVAWMFDAA